MQHLTPKLQQLFDQIDTCDLTFISQSNRDDYLFRFEEYRTGGSDEYLATNYVSAPSMTPGLVRCHDEEEAELFLTLLKQRFDQPEPFDYSMVLQVHERMVKEAMRGALYQFTDNDQVELPLTDGEVPYWASEGQWWRNQETVFTCNWAYGYVNSRSTPVPTGENETSLFIDTVADVDSEYHLELGDIGEFEEWWGIKPVTLEWFLLHQLFCHNKNLAHETPRWGYFQYGLLGTVWLTPVPQNLSALMRVLKSDEFFHHYDWSEPFEAVRRWLTAVTDHEDLEDYQEQFEKVIQESLTYLEEKYR
ncbi:hypothetical protein ACQ4M3_09300 [Leptolyngbya sp. AN03gr2]|uniref:hypothetical protein n=1 Tax=Leptolyngbya sp. AN03gr2 TaxID=3423364 RepID=UPI003D314423